MNFVKYVIIICFFLVALFSCQSKNNNSSTTIKQESESVEYKEADLTKNEVKDLFHLTKDEIHILEQESKIGNMIIFGIGRTTTIMSDGKLTYYLLGQDLSDYGIQNRFKRIFNLEHQTINNDAFSSPQKVSKFVFKQSFFKIYNSEGSQFNVISGKIKNEEIFMPMNIYIGISRNDFFIKIFNNANQYDFSVVDTLFNGNEQGDIQQEYVFKNDTLKEVILKSDCDWIPFEL